MMRKLILIAALSSFTLTGCDAVKDMSSKLRSGKKTANVSETAKTVQPQKAKDVEPLGYLLDVNEAKNSQLQRVPGLTPEIFKLIQDTRPFLDMFEFDDELDIINLSTKERQALYAHIFMVIDINNSPVEDLQFVPGLSKSLAHKIESGRPYTKLSDLKAVIEKSRQSKDTEQLMPYFKVVKPKK